MHWVQVTYKKVRNCLSALLNRQFLTFLFFLGLSASFWFLLALDREYEFEVEVPLQLTNVPKNVIITTDPPKSVKLTLKGKGSDMLVYRYLKKIQPANFPFSSLNTSSQHVIISRTELLKLITPRLSSNVRIVSVHPEQPDFFYNNGLNKKVPVRLTGKIKANKLFYISAISVVPDSVQVYASKEILDTLRFAYLEPVYYRSLQDTTRIRRNFKSIRGAKFDPASAQINVYVDQLTEKTVQVPVQWVNFPATKILRTFPSKVNITFQVGASMYRRITADNFVLVVNYADLINNKQNKCKLQLKSLPQGVSHVRISPSEIDYVIEDVSEN